MLRAIEPIKVMWIVSRSMYQPKTMFTQQIAINNGSLIGDQTEITSN